MAAWSTRYQTSSSRSSPRLIAAFFRASMSARIVGPSSVRSEATVKRTTSRSTWARERPRLELRAHDRPQLLDGVDDELLAVRVGHDAGAARVLVGADAVVAGVGRDDRVRILWTQRVDGEGLNAAQIDFTLWNSYETGGLVTETGVGMVKRMRCEPWDADFFKGPLCLKI